MRVVPGSQLTLELQPDLLRRYSTLRQCVHHVALNYPRGMKALAAECDLSESELSRRLNPSPNDPRSLDVNLMTQIMDVTDDYTPVHWLVARFLRDPEGRVNAAVEQLAQMVPHLMTLLAEAGISKPAGKRNGGRG